MTIEQLLAQALKNPAMRPAFYDALLVSDIYIISNRLLEKGVVQPQEELTIRTWRRNDDKIIVPFFSNLALLKKQLNETSGYFCMNCRAFFRIIQSSFAVLNPGSERSKEFTSQEIQSLLNGQMPHVKKHVITEETELSLRAFEAYPQALVDALTAFFEHASAVKQAYLLQCIIKESETQNQPNFMLAVDFNGAEQPLFNQLAFAVQPYTPVHGFFDIIQLNGSELSAVIRNNFLPFYVKKIYNLFDVQ